MTTRRDFLKTAGALTLGGLALSIDSSAAQLKSVGLQLYTLRDHIVKDTKGTLKKVAAAGYKELESYAGEKGPYFGMKPKEFKAFVEGLGMHVRSSHVGIDKDFQATADAAAEAGISYLLCPYMDATKRPDLDGFKRTAEEFNKLGEITKKNGIQFGYHNHDYAFKEMEGEIPYDVMLKATDADLVTFEMDLYWVVRAGKDPIAYFNQYPGRFPLWHVKDMDKANNELNTEVGMGSIDFNPIFKNASKAGLKFAFVEQENFKMEPFASIKKSRVYVAGIKY